MYITPVEKSIEHHDIIPPYSKTSGAPPNDTPFWPLWRMLVYYICRSRVTDHNSQIRTVFIVHCPRTNWYPNARMEGKNQCILMDNNTEYIAAVTDCIGCPKVCVYLNSITDPWPEKSARISLPNPFRNEHFFDTIVLWLSGRYLQTTNAPRKSL